MEPVLENLVALPPVDGCKLSLGEWPVAHPTVPASRPKLGRHVLSRIPHECVCYIA